MRRRSRSSLFSSSWRFLSRRFRSRSARESCWTNTDCFFLRCSFILRLCSAWSLDSGIDHQSNDGRRGGETGEGIGEDSILLVGFDVSDLVTVGTSAGSTRGDFIARSGCPWGSSVPVGGRFAMQLLLLLSSLSASLVLFQALKFFLNSVPPCQQPE